MRARGFRFLAGVWIAVLLPCYYCFAQTITGSISGTVGYHRIVSPILGTTSKTHRQTSAARSLSATPIIFAAIPAATISGCGRVSPEDSTSSSWRN